MIDEWVSIRSLLADDPKTKSVVDWLISHGPFLEWLGVPADKIPRNALCGVTVMGFIRIWALGNSRGFRDGDDVILTHADFSWIDEVSKVPGLGLAMESVGWAHEDYHEGTKAVRLPNFVEYNVPAEDRSEKEKTAREKNRERQRRFRAKKNGNAGNGRVTANNAPTEQHRTAPDRTEPPLRDAYAPSMDRRVQRGKDLGGEQGKTGPDEFGARAREPNGEDLGDTEPPAKRPDEGREIEAIPYGFANRVWEFWGVCQVSARPDEIGFFAKLAWADCSGWGLPPHRPLMDVLGRAKRARSPAAQVTHVLKTEFPREYEIFKASFPTHTHCLWALEEIDQGRRKEGRHE